jgi:peptidoglycan LD-endopeptidase CwlK
MFALGPASRKELTGVHPKLVEVDKLAISRSTQDFSVHDGVRTAAEQHRMVASGASTTTNSKHLIQPDGYGHATDLVPFLNGKPRWEWPLIYPIAAAMQDAARSLGVKVRWGGVWDVCLNDLPLGAAALEISVARYVERRKKLHPGKAVFIDGPHFELIA